MFRNYYISKSKLRKSIDMTFFILFKMSQKSAFNYKINCTNILYLSNLIYTRFILSKYTYKTCQCKLSLLGVFGQNFPILSHSAIYGNYWVVLLWTAGIMLGVCCFKLRWRNAMITREHV